METYIYDVVQTSQTLARLSSKTKYSAVRVLTSI